MILVECCSQLSSRRNASDFKKAFGLSMPYDLVASLTDIVNTSKCDIDDAIEMLQYAEDTGKYAYGKEEDQYCVSFNIRKEFCLMVRDSNAPQFEVIRQLVKFYSDHGKNDN